MTAGHTPGPLTMTPLDHPEDHAVEFRAGPHVAYGTYEGPEVYCVDHAPTQADFDAVTAALALAEGGAA